MSHSDTVVLLVEGDELVRGSLDEVIRNAGYRTEVFDSLPEFMLRACVRGVGCALVDLLIPGSPGLGLLRTLRTSGFRLPVILLSNQPSVPLSIEAIRSGAANFLVKPLESALVLRAVKEAVEQSRGTYALRCELEAIQQRAASLTRREMEVFQEVTAGYLNKQIAQHLGTAEKTIKVHRGRVMKKMGARSVVDLVRMAERLDTAPIRADLGCGVSSDVRPGSNFPSNGAVGAARATHSATDPARDSEERLEPRLPCSDGEKGRANGNRARTDTAC